MEPFRPWGQYWSRLTRMIKQSPVVVSILGTAAAIFAVPLLLIAMLIGSRLLMVVAGPVNIWNTTWHTPPVDELVGYYKLSETRLGGRILPSAANSWRSGLRLMMDHRVEVFDLPEFDGGGSPANCTLSGKGTWSSSEDAGMKLYLNIEVTNPSPSENAQSCGPISMVPFHVLGHSPPYRLWYNVGDPDQGMGMTYAREGP